MTALNESASTQPASSAPSSDARRIDGLPLSEAERRQYAEEGFFVRERVFSDADLERFRSAAERVVALAAAEAKEPVAAENDRDSVRLDDHDSVRLDDADSVRLDNADSVSTADRDYIIDGNRYFEASRATVQFEHREGSETIRVIEPFHHLDPVFDALVEDPRIVSPVCGVLGEDQIALWTDKLNLKRPREGSGFRWHQDSPYWSHVCGHCDRLPNVMITLDDADRGNGCFRLVPGSHREGFLPGIDDGSRLGPLFTDPSAFDESAQWLAELPAGSLVVFDSHIVHGSQPNESDRSRRAIVLTYQPGGHAMFKREGTRNFDLPELPLESLPATEPGS